MGVLKLGGGIDKKYIGDMFSDNLDYEDEVFLCRIACQCNKAPLIAKDGSERKQNCMSNRLDSLGNNSIYKAEVNYDMTQVPPEAILESTPTFGMEPQKHPYLSGWIGKYWKDPAKHRPPWKPGQGYIRRPDIIIVHNPRKSPVQSNMKKVVEVKFPGDSFGPKQLASYVEIAGSEDKVAVLMIKKCGCSDEKRERDMVTEPKAIPAEEKSPTPFQVQDEVQAEADDSYAYYDGDNVMHVVASPVDDKDNSSYSLGKFFYLSPADQQIFAESAGIALAALATFVAYAWLALLA